MPTPSSRNSNANGMSLKKARAILKGEKASFKRDMGNHKLTEERLARADGAPVDAAGAAVDKATERVVDGYDYALAALAVFEKQNPGKSALKEFERLSLGNAAS